MADADDLSGRFISAVEKMKAALETQYQGVFFTGLGQVVRHAKEKRHSVVTRNERLLDRIITLRNAVQHEAYRHGEPVATPRASFVEETERLAEIIVRPPQIKDYMTKSPSCLSPEVRLGEAAGMIIDHNLSQIPVYADDEYVGLFTTNGLARWLSSAIDPSGEIMQESPTIADVLLFNEHSDTARFGKPTETALRVCDWLSGEKAPHAVLVTTDGTPRGQLQGIVTRFDVPGILRAVTID